MALVEARKMEKYVLSCPTILMGSCVLYIFSGRIAVFDLFRVLFFHPARKSAHDPSIPQRLPRQQETTKKSGEDPKGLYIYILSIDPTMFLPISSAIIQQYVQFIPVLLDYFEY
jgi:hypothetical protein